MALYKSEIVYLYTTSLYGTKPKNIRIIEKEGEPYLIDWETNLVMNARISGQIVDKIFYETF